MKVLKPKSKRGRITLAQATAAVRRVRAKAPTITQLDDFTRSDLQSPSDISRDHKDPSSPQILEGPSPGVSEMVDRVARAIWERREARKARPEGWEFVPANHPGKRVAREDARAAISAMNEPTHAMAFRGGARLYGDSGAVFGRDMAINAWSAMIEEALNG